MLRRASLTLLLASFSTSCTVTKDPITINYTGLNYSVALPKDESVDPQLVTEPSVQPVLNPSAAASAPVGCPEFKVPFLGRIPVLTQEEINKTRGDDKARQRQLIEHIETLHRFTVSEQNRIREAARRHKKGCSK